MSSTETRTVAFQVPTDLFEQFKAYLDRHHIKQKTFFLDCIQRVLADEEPLAPEVPAGSQASACAESEEETLAE